MKFSCLREHLSKGLIISSKALPSKVIQPITNNVLIKAVKDSIFLTVTNFELAITAQVIAKVEEPGMTTVPARVFSDIVSALPNDRVDIQLENNRLELACARSRSKLACVDAKDFPPVPTINSGPVIKLDLKAFQSSIVKTIVAVAEEASRPVLTGIQCDFDEDQLTMAAANGFQLAFTYLQFTATGKVDTSALIPSQTLREICKITAHDGDVIELMVDQLHKRVLFRMPDIEIVSQMINGDFPKYKSLIPKNYPNTVTVYNEELLRAVKQAMVIAKDSTRVIRLEIKPGEELKPGHVLITAKADELGENNNEIDAIVDGEGAKIAFNGKYLMECISVAGTEKIDIELKDSQSPCLITPDDNQSGYVLMPMFVQW